MSDTMWRARLWIPYGAMPVGLGILTLQYVADLLNLLTGREPPFGIEVKDAPRRSLPTDRVKSGSRHMSPSAQGVLVLVTTVLVLLTGAPVAFALGAVGVAFLVLFQGADSLRVAAETLYSGLNDFTLVSIPMFIMMGAAIGSSPAGKDLYYRARSLALPGAWRAGDFQYRRLRAVRGADRLLAGDLRRHRQDGHTGDARARLSGRSGDRLDLRRWHARHPDPAVDHLHPLRHRDRDLHRSSVPGRGAAGLVADWPLHAVDAGLHLVQRLPCLRGGIPFHLAREVRDRSRKSRPSW